LLGKYQRKYEPPQTRAGYYLLIRARTINSGVLPSISIILHCPYSLLLEQNTNATIKFLLAGSFYWYNFYENFHD
jgi:hypothetical protein